jgi:Phosphate-selective porin O and P
MPHGPRVVPPVSLVLHLTLGLLAATAADAGAQAAPPPPITIGGVTIGGYVQADAIFSEAADDDSEPGGTFEIPRARVGLSGDITSKVSWTLGGDFATLTRDGRILRDAYVPFTASRQFAVRFGQFVAPFSLERLTGYSKLEVIDRSVVGALLAPSRDFGLMVFNVTPWRGWLTYGAAVINGTGQNRADNNGAKDLVGRVAARVPRVDGLTIGVNAQNGEQPLGNRRRLGLDVNLEGPQYRVAIERVAERRDLASTTVDTGGFTVIGVFKHPAAHRTPHYAGYELAARYVDVEDDAVTLESHQIQAGGTYFVTPQLRVQSNVLIPIGDDQPRQSARWWSRLQFNF